MSELGSKKGQSENKNTPIFDSSELETKQKTDQFVNVKDAEARKKEAERKAKEVEKKAENEHKEAVKEAAKKASKEVRGSKGGILNLLFGGWHKIVAISLLLVLLVGCGWLIFTKTNDSENAIKERDSSAILYAQRVYSEAEDARLAGSYKEAKKKFEEALADSNREEKIFISVKYAEYIASMEYDSETAYRLLDEAKTISKTEVEEQYINTGYLNVEMYTGVEDE